MRSISGAGRWTEQRPLHAAPYTNDDGGKAASALGNELSLTSAPGLVPGLTFRYANLSTPTLSLMGSFDLTGMGGGSVTLVSPTRISIDGPLAQRRTAGYTTLELHFAPELGMLLLLGAGAATLMMVARRRPD